MKRNKKGISLIVLVITIIVMIILASAITLSMLNGNPIDNASQATFKNDIAYFQATLETYLNDLSMQTAGLFEKEYFSATKDNMTYTGEGDIQTSGKTMFDIFDSMEGTEYEEYLYVENGELAYDSSKLDEYQKVWIKKILENK